MQNRYVADIGDYVKFAILRALSSGRRLGVAWWLFPDENHKRDGRHTEYLERPKEWRRFDPKLFDALRKINRQDTRHIAALEHSDILAAAVFVSDPIPCELRPFSRRPTERASWFAGVKAALASHNLIFVDPDNGIASDFLKLTVQRAGKSVTIQELKELQDGLRPTVVYHHQTRFKGGHDREIYVLNRRLTENGIHVSGVIRARPWSPRAFFILNGDEELQSRARAIAEYWNGHLSWYPSSEIETLMK